MNKLLHCGLFIYPSFKTVLSLSGSRCCRRLSRPPVGEGSGHHGQVTSMSQGLCGLIRFFFHDDEKANSYVNISLLFFK